MWTSSGFLIALSELVLSAPLARTANHICETAFVRKAIFSEPVDGIDDNHGRQFGQSILR
jgi:hypothetical protein